MKYIKIYLQNINVLFFISFKIFLEFQTRIPQKFQ